MYKRKFYGKGEGDFSELYLLRGKEWKDTQENKRKEKKTLLTLSCTFVKSY